MRVMTCVAASAALLAPSADALCHAQCKTVNNQKECTYKFRLSVFASETGYYSVDGCEGTQPTLSMEAGVKYIFDQTDITNWMHPLGFAYYPDGAHKGVDELEPGIKHGDTTYCDPAQNNCMVPRYYTNGAYVGSAVDAADFGLDVYEPDFKLPRGVWAGKKFTVQLTVTDPAVGDIFYFCHIHDGMSGRIKVMNAGQTVPRQVADSPALGYEYHGTTAFDTTCGTQGVADFQAGGGKCPDMTFLCGVSGSKAEQFGQCMVALDCAMHVGMRVQLHEDPLVTFIHQMIPHHQNAVNMAKTLLKTGRLAKEDDMQRMMWEIINSQNAQITEMRGWLAENKQKSGESNLCAHLEDESDDGLSGGTIAGIVLGCVGIVALLAVIVLLVLKRSPSDHQADVVPAASKEPADLEA